LQRHELTDLHTSSFRLAQRPHFTAVSMRYSIPILFFKNVVPPLGGLNATPPKGGTTICLQRM
jgi:hypothetical protein